MSNLFDPHNNLAYSIIQGGGVVGSTTGTSIQLYPGDGARFSVGQNVTVWPPGVDPSFGGGGNTTNAEIMRITFIDIDTLTVLRIQESSIEDPVALGNIAIGYQIANTESAKVFTDIEQQRYNRTAVSDAAYQVLASDYLIAYTALTAGRAVTLTDATVVPAGKVYQFKDETGSAATYNITITPVNSQTIDGAATKAINTNYGYLLIYTNGSEWFTGT